MSIKTISKGVAAMITVKLLLFAGTAVYAQQAQSVSAPRTLSYQGVLTSTGTPGNILGANRLLTVTLYGDANGTIKLWQSTMNTPIDSNGVFNCMLGTADNPLPQPSVMDRAIWLGVAVDNGTELRPLSQVTASAYAINVADSAITSQKIATGAVGTQSLADGSITTSKLADSSITASKMNMNYVSSIRVNGQPITGTGTNLNIVAGDGLSAIWVPDESTLTLSNSGGTGGSKTMSVITDWQLLGNATTSVPTNFIGTTDATSGFEIHLEDGGTAPDNTRVAHFEFKATSPNIIMGFGSGSGTGNAITGFGSTIAGGGASTTPNIIGSSTFTSEFSFIGGGTSNTINAINAAIAGGQGNTIGSSTFTSEFSFIGGGTSNTINAINAAIAGGQGNTIEVNPTQLIGGQFSAILGGENNMLQGQTSSIGGGDNNFINYSDTFCFIGGGENNSITWNTADHHNPSQEGTNFHVIGGGLNNTIITEINGSTENGWMGAITIGGGQGNTALGPWGFIAGGENNIISSTIPTTDDDREDQMVMDAIGGGLGNSIDTFSSHSNIGGGWGNHIGGQFFVLHQFDTIIADRDVIGGGYYNTILKVRDGVIAGGNGNTLLPKTGDNGACAAIGGGYLNSTQFQFSNIPGGDGLTTDGEAQTVIGAGNIEAGNSHIIYSSLMNANDDRIFEVGSPVFRDGGSGPNWYATNAFEVSYNGHSIVYHTNGTSIPGGGTPPVFQGATYVESPVYAWGEVSETGNAVGDANFGISQCEAIGFGTYMVTLCPQDPYNPSKTVDISRASVTVTIVNNDVSDINVAPPPPPISDGAIGGSMQSSVTDKVIPDSMILAARGSIAYPSNAMMPQTDTLPNDTLPIDSSYVCGYATASQIGVLVPKFGAAYANSFIVRTYRNNPESDQCALMPLPFFFKVCHR